MRRAAHAARRRRRRARRGPRRAASPARAASARRRRAPSRSPRAPRGARRARRCRPPRRPRSRSRRRGRRCACVANSRWFGVEYANWLLSTMNTTGSRRTPAKLSASCQSERLVEPSPDQPSATRASPRMRKASAQPVATGTIAGRCETIAIRPRRSSAMWTLPSRPAVGPSTRPMYWAKIRHGSVPRATCTPMSRCVGAPMSSMPIAKPTPTAARLVAAPGVEGAGDLPLAEQHVPALLDSPGHEHEPIQLDEVDAVEATPARFSERADGCGFPGNRHSGCSLARYVWGTCPLRSRSRRW